MRAMPSCQAVEDDLQIINLFVAKETNKYRLMNQEDPSDSVGEAPKIWNAGLGERLETLAGHEALVTVSVSSDAASVVTSSHDAS